MQYFWCQTGAVALGFLLDLIFGDPHWLYHPVQLIGSLISKLEKVLLKDTDSDKKKFRNGALLAVLVLTPAPLALSASRTRPLSMLLLVLTAVLAKVLAPLVQSSRNNHSVPNPLCSVCCAGDFLMQKFIDGLIQALYPAAELFLLLWYRAFALFYTLYGTLTHFTERLQGTAKHVQFFTQTIRQHGRYRLNSAVQ